MQFPNPLPPPAVTVFIRDLLAPETDFAISDPAIFSLATHLQEEHLFLCEFVLFEQADAELFIRFREEYPQLADMLPKVGWKVRAREKEYVVFVDDFLHDPVYMLEALIERPSQFLSTEWLESISFIVEYGYLLNADTFDQLLEEFRSF